MRPALSVFLLLVSVTIPQSCQRDAATAPQSFAPSANLEGLFKASIAFTSNRDGTSGIYVMAPDGSAVTRLITGTEPSWSPDGSRIAFVGFADGNQEIFVMNADGSAPTRLTTNPAGDLSPSWSPDGRQIAFMSTRDGNAEIYVMNADGSVPSRLTTNSAHDLEPSWSPDGRRIAFTSLRDGNSEIYVMGTDGSAQTRLTNNTSFDGQPSWSPDGRQIAFSSNRDGSDDLYVMNGDGSGQTPLTNSLAVDQEPSWSPDGRQIAFRSSRDGNDEVYVMNADGSGLTRLTNNPAFDGEPSWSPKAPGRAPAHLAFTSQPPAGVWANAAISPALQVTVTDESGDLVAGGNVRLAIGTSPTAGATLSGTTNAQVANGVATFSDVRIDQLGRGYTLVAQAGNVSGSSTAFAVVEPATHLAFVTQPPTSAEGGTAMQPVRVAIQDSLGNTLNRASAPVTLALAANPTGAKLQGTTMVETVNGIATFADLRVDNLGSGYTFAVTSPGRAGATSSPFAVYVAFTTLAAGGGHTCGMTTSNAVYCWGSNAWGELGIGIDRDGHPGGDPPSTTPVPVVGGLSFTSISLGVSESCGVTTGGAGYCWGLVPSPRSDFYRASPLAVGGGHTFTRISAGGVGPSHACDVSTSGAAYCWGQDGWGQLGDSAFGSAGKSEPVAVAGGLTFTTISAGGLHTCGVTGSGAAYCWGDNRQGQVGDGSSTTFWIYPVPVAGGISFTTITAGRAHTCALTTDGTAYCWGSNTSGQLGDGSGAQQGTPVPVAGGLSFATISAGSEHTCGVTTSGEAYCWGANPDGRLGDGTTVQRATAVPVAGGLRFSTISAGGAHTCGMTSERGAYCWGGNGTGQLGDGTTTGRLTPVPVATGTPSLTAMRTIP